MKINSRLQAFTILELTISMLIAAVVIGITYTSYTIISRSYLGFKSKNEQMALLARMDQLLRKDFDHAEQVSAADDQLRIQNVNGTVVNYHFTDSCMTRSSVIIDTFKVVMDKPKLFFEHQLKENVVIDRIDELSFNITYQSEIIPYHYYKVYSSENLIQENPNAVN